MCACIHYLVINITDIFEIYRCHEQNVLLCKISYRIENVVLSLLLNTFKIII